MLSTAPHFVEINISKILNLKIYILIKKYIISRKIPYYTTFIVVMLFTPFTKLIWAQVQVGVSIQAGVSGWRTIAANDFIVDYSGILDHQFGANLSYGSSVDLRGPIFRNFFYDTGVGISVEKYNFRVVTYNVGNDIEIGDLSMQSKYINIPFSIGKSIFESNPKETLISFGLVSSILINAKDNFAEINLYERPTSNTKDLYSSLIIDGILTLERELKSMKKGSLYGSVFFCYSLTSFIDSQNEDALSWISEIYREFEGFNRLRLGIQISYFLN